MKEERTIRTIDTAKLQFLLGVGKAHLQSWDRKSPKYREVEKHVADIERELERRKQCTHKRS